MTRRITATATLAAAVSMLAACGSAPQATPTRPTVTVTSTAETAPASTGGETAVNSGAGATDRVTSDPEGSDTSSGSSTDECAPDIGLRAAAARDVNRIPPPSVNGSWRAYNAGGTWCPGLSWVEVSRAESLVPIRPHQLLIYHGGHFQGTGIRCEARHGQYILATAPDAITVQYSYLDLTNPEQQRSQAGVGKAVVTFRWNGSRIVMDGTLPYAFTEGKC